MVRRKKLLNFHLPATQSKAQNFQAGTYGAMKNRASRWVLNISICNSSAPRWIRVLPGGCKTRGKCFISTQPVFYLLALTEGEYWDCCCCHLLLMREARWVWAKVIFFRVILSVCDTSLKDIPVLQQYLQIKACDTDQQEPLQLRLHFGPF